MKACVLRSPSDRNEGASLHTLGAAQTPAVFLSLPSSGSPGLRLDPGARLGRYAIVRHLGSGRTAHVYLAHDDLRDHEVALKVADLRPDTAVQIEARMRREIDIRRRVGSHPHVLVLFDANRVRLGGLDLFVLSMEYADGGDFRQWLAQSDDPAERLETGVANVLEAARGLLTLHRAGVVHLDFKPENLLCARGVWKIADLDHALLVGDLPAGRSASGPQDSWPMGTPGYASPETCEAGSVPVDTRSDIYSLGVVLRETLRPIGHLTTRRRPTVRSRHGPTIARVVARCLRPDPNQRLQLVDHVIDLFGAIRSGNAQTTVTGEWPRDDRRWRHARRCFAEGRLADARRLCRTLLDACPRHPGASGIVADVDRREAQALETARQLAMNAHTVAVGDVLGPLREITELVPDHQETVGLIALAEERVAKCHGALVDALTYLSSASLTDFAEALDRAASLDPNDPLAVDACVGARDLASLCNGVHDRIAEAVRAHDYPQALQLTRIHRRFLATLASRARRILAAAEDPTTSVSRRSL